jgi:transposase InsO family protein
VKVGWDWSTRSPVSVTPSTYDGFFSILLGIREVLGAPRSPWQRAYVERIIGSIRRDCLDHVIVFDQASLRRLLGSYLDYYHISRTHLSLNKDTPVTRSVQSAGRIVASPQIGGLHHRYERQAA